MLTKLKFALYSSKSNSCTPSYCSNLNHFQVKHFHPANFYIRDYVYTWIKHDVCHYNLVTLYKGLLKGSGFKSIVKLWSEAQPLAFFYRDFKN